MATGEVYEEAARLMLKAAREGKPLKPVLKACCPWIETQLRKSARSPELLGLWGQSVNVDEHAGTVIVEPPILQILGELAGAPLLSPVVHAGLQHTYGYLFSLIETPYGKKRDRWLAPDLDEGLGFDVPTLRDDPEEGTLLLNLTFCLARIAFRNQPELLERVETCSAGVASSAKKYPYDKLRIRRVVERVTIPSGRRKRTKIELYTDLVSLKPTRKSAEKTLLVYSVLNGRRLGLQLITAFPVSGNHAEEITALQNQGEHVEVRTRYNAYVEGLSEQPAFGRRFIVE